MKDMNSANFPILSTERLTLRQLTVDDHQDIFALRSDPAINRFLGRQLCKTQEEAIQFIHLVNDNIVKGAGYYWAITLAEIKKLAGTICLYDFSFENSSCEIGYELMTEFQRQGIMKEAAGKVIDYAFNNLKVQKIEAFFHRDNQRSINLLEQCCFKHSIEKDEANKELIGYHLKKSFYSNTFNGVSAA